jgi:LysR family nitrogen assimilation transcriptional regulator
MTTLHYELVEKQLFPIGKKLSVTALIDSVDSIRELVLRGKWATIMPVSTFKEIGPSSDVVMSEITGVQLNRLLVLASRKDKNHNQSASLVRDMVEQEFRRLIAEDVFSLSNLHPHSK